MAIDYTLQPGETTQAYLARTQGAIAANNPTDPNATRLVAPSATPQPSPVQTTQPTQTPAPTPSVTINNNTTPPAQTQQKAQPTSPSLAQPTNGSVVDLLNSAGQDSSFAARQQLAQNYGIQGYTGTAAQNQELSKKYLEAYNAKKGTAVPQTGADARSQMSQYFQETPQQEMKDPERSFFDEYMQMNPVVKSLYDAINQELSHTTTQQSFKDEYASLQKEQGVEALNTELMNIQNIMQGTEDDIREEITKSGGFATESQVQALTGVRNKVLLKQANVLSQQLAAKNDYIDHLMQFSEMDRSAIEKQVDRRLNLTAKLADLQTSITTAAHDNYQSIVNKVGYSGLAGALAGDKAGADMAEKALGLPRGILTNPNALQFLTPSTEQKPYQFISATDNQAGGVFDPNTGTFTPRGGGGGGSGGIGGGGVGGGVVSPATQQALKIILGSGKFTKDQTKQITDAINSGQDPFIVIKNQAKNIMGQTEATQVQKYEVARDTLASIGKQLQQFYSQGGSTDIFTGNMEKVYNKLGNVHDPKLVNLATQIQGNLQVYRNAISGTAYSAQEGQDIASIFPGINKTEQLNNAILRGRQTLFDDVIDANYRAALGGTYDTLKASTTAKTPTPPGTIVTIRLKQYKVGSDGDTLEPIEPVAIDWKKLVPVSSLKI